MLEIVEEYFKFVASAYFISAQAVNNFRDWQIVLEPEDITISACNMITLTFRQCIYIDFKGFQHQSDIFRSDSAVPELIPQVMEWRELDNSDLLKDYFLEKGRFANDNIYGPGKPIMPEYLSKFHHIQLFGQELHVDVLCEKVDAVKG
jgi:hypothetical protein